MSDDLIDRLRNFTEEDAYATPWTFGKVVHAAADELARLHTQLGLQKAMVQEERRLRIRREAELYSLRAALSDERAHADVLAGALAEATDDLDAWVSHRDDLIRSGYDVDYSAAVSKRGGAALAQHRARRQG